MGSIRLSDDFLKGMEIECHVCGEAAVHLVRPDVNAKLRFLCDKCLKKLVQGRTQ